MNRATCALLVVSSLACHAREDAAPHAEATSTPVATDTSVVAATAPSETAAPIASVVASAAPLDPREARAAALASAREVGMIGLIGSMGDGGGAPWGREDSLGESFGMGGLGLSGVGRDGGGGGGRGIPHIRQGTTTVNGRLPPEVIQRIVRQNFGRFRLCYEQGLRADPKLAGTVATKFVIDTTGAVSSAARDSSTTLTDANVVSCITRAFGNLSFPQPEGGIVVVTYPVILEPGDAKP